MKTKCPGVGMFSHKLNISACLVIRATRGSEDLDRGMVKSVDVVFVVSWMIIETPVSNISRHV